MIPPSPVTTRRAESHFATGGRPRRGERGRHHRRGWRRALAVVTALAVALVGGVVAAAPAYAAARLTVTYADGASAAAVDSATKITVRGAGFQSIPKGFGGVYVLFGWVDDAAGGSWRPSKGGQVGSDYRYVPDTEAHDNAGYQRFVSFPGSETEAAAQAVMKADGTWSVSMVVPGAEFQSLDRNGKTSSVDCLKVTCGIITIGAHGVKNANNETFTPVRFASAATTGTGTGTGTSTTTKSPATAPGDVRVGVESAQVAAGNAVVFTGRGFTPGEQVMASLDGGLAAVGPLTAGAQGEVAGALSVPLDARAGTHLLSLRGAASDAVAQAEVSVTSSASATALVAESPAPATPPWVLVVLVLSVVLALILVIASVVVSIRRGRTRRRERRAAEAAA